MKKLLLIASLAFAVFACSKDTDSGGSSGDRPCGTYNGKTLYRGSEGGCYYKNSNGNKTYVDRSECRC